MSEASTAVHGHHHHHTTFTVTVRTPAGHPGTFTVEPDEHIATVVHHAVAYFTGRGELAPGRYGLALIRDGVATPLVDSARLEDYGIDAESDLRLVSRDPHVDG